MIDSQKVLYSQGNNDECYTPDYAVKPIVKYIPKDWVVWCPFDKEDSEFVKQIKANGNKVISTHIENGQDFFTYEPDEHWDCIISNPPFTGKRHIFERALSFNKPFSLLMALTWLNDSAPKLLFMERDLQLLMFDKRKMNTYYIDIYLYKDDDLVANSNSIYVKMPEARAENLLLFFKVLNDNNRDVKIEMDRV